MNHIEFELWIIAFCFGRSLFFLYCCCMAGLIWYYGSVAVARVKTVVGLKPSQVRLRRAIILCKRLFVVIIPHCIIWPCFSVSIAVNRIQSWEHQWTVLSCTIVYHPVRLPMKVKTASACSPATWPIIWFPRYTPILKSLSDSDQQKMEQSIPVVLQHFVVPGSTW